MDEFEDVDPWQGCEIPSIVFTLEVSVDATGHIAIEIPEKDNSYEITDADTIEEAVKDYENVLKLMKKNIAQGNVEYLPEKLQKDLEEL